MRILIYSHISSHCCISHVAISHFPRWQLHWHFNWLSFFFLFVFICRTVITQMEPFVHDDYVIAYFHQGLNESNKPPIQFLWNSYKEMLDRKFRKNLKRLYVVHPTWTIKVIWNFFKPFISEKFKNKLVYVSNLEQLKQELGLTILKLPQTIQEYVYNLECYIHSFIF